MDFKQYLKLAVSVTLLQQSVAVYAAEPIQTISPQRILATATKSDVTALMKHAELTRQQIEKILNDRFEVVTSERIGYIQGSFEQYSQEMQYVVRRRPSILRGIGGAALLALLGAGLGFGIGAVGLVAASGVNAAVGGATAATIMTGGALAGGAVGGASGAQLGAGDAGVQPTGKMLKTGEGKIEGETYQIHDTASVFSAIVMDKENLDGYLQFTKDNSGNAGYAKALAALRNLMAQRSTLSKQEAKQVIDLMDEYNSAINDLNIAYIDMVSEDMSLAGQVQTFIDNQNEWRKDKRIVMAGIEIDPLKDLTGLTNAEQITAKIADKSTPVSSYLTKAGDFHTLVGTAVNAKVEQAIQKENDEMLKLSLASVVLTAQLDKQYNAAIKDMLPGGRENKAALVHAASGAGIFGLLAGFVVGFFGESYNMTKTGDILQSTAGGSIIVGGLLLAGGIVTSLFIKTDDDYLKNLSEQIMTDNRLEVEVRKTSGFVARILNLDQDKANRLTEALKKEMVKEILATVESHKKQNYQSDRSHINDNLDLSSIQINPLKVAKDAKLIDEETFTTVDHIFNYLSQTSKADTQIDVPNLLSLNLAVLKKMRSGLSEVMGNKQLAPNKISSLKTTIEDIDRHIAYADQLQSLLK